MFYYIVAKTDTLTAASGLTRTDTAMLVELSCAVAETHTGGPHIEFATPVLADRTLIFNH